MDISNNKIEQINNQIKKNDFILVLFDTFNSKYLNYNLENNDYKLIHISDSEVINFYEIDILPTISVFHNKNLIHNIEGFKTKTELLKILNNL